MNLGRLARITVAVSCAGLVTTSAASPNQSAAVPTFAHVVVVVMENTSASSVIGNTSVAPYINSLAASYAYSSNDFAITHPSLPNYLALTGASTFGITTDCSPAACPVNATNLMDRIESAGLSWKAYMESMPSACATTDAYPYAVKHNPFVYYNDIRNNASRCQSHVVPFTQLSSDLRSTSTTPTYSWITPNMCNDMHDCSIATGDTWLSQQIPSILNSPAFTTQNSLLLLTWDEDDFLGNNRVDLVVAGPQVTRGIVSNVPLNHYSILSTLESAWNLAALNANDSTATPLTSFFTGSVASVPCSGAAIAATPPASQMAGTPIIFTASSTGCPNPLYQFVIRPASQSNWQTVQPYSTSPTYNWNSTGAATGTVYFGIWVKDASSSAAVDAYTSMPFSVTAPSCASISISGVPASVAQGAGTHVTVTGFAAGCSHLNPLYEFVIRPASQSNWQTVQTYSTSPSYNWNSTGAAGGTVFVGVHVRDANSTAIYDAVASTPFTVTTPSCASVSASASPTSVSGGTHVTVTASATGCTNSPRYEFWLRPASSSTWQLVQIQGTSATYDWNTAGALPGTVYLGVHVRDANSAASYDAVGSTPVTVA
jgi:acid phosphatase